MKKLSSFEKIWITQLHGTGEYSSRDIAEVVLGRASRKSTVNDFLKSYEPVEEKLFGTIWDKAPEWATVILSKYGRRVYLESDVKGVAGRIKWFDKAVDQCSSEHFWHLPCSQANVIARRVLKVPEAVEGLSGTIWVQSSDWPTSAVAVEPVEEIQRETHLFVAVFDSETSEIVLAHDDSELGDNAVSHVSQFAEVMMGAYKALGFQNKMTIKFKGALGNKKFVCNP